jgi:hypothetical protein
MNSSMESGIVPCLYGTVPDYSPMPVVVPCLWDCPRLHARLRHGPMGLVQTPCSLAREHGVWDYYGTIPGSLPELKSGNIGLWDCP